MHILLTDRLTCPRCGPEFGLILLAHHIQDRRVIEGEIGCANCRERFTIRGGFGDLTWPPDGEGSDRADLNADGPPRSEAVLSEAASGKPARSEAALRVAALLGVTGGPGHVLLMGSSVRYAAPLADLLAEIEWVAAGVGARRLRERPGVSRLGASAERLPFFSGVLQGAVCEGADAAGLAEALRVVTFNARVVLIDPPEEAKRVLDNAGFEAVLEDDDTLVAARRRAGTGVASPPGRN